MRKERDQNKTSDKRKVKKLKVNKETIKDLEPREPSQVKAGNLPGTIYTETLGVCCITMRCTLKC